MCFGSLALNEKITACQECLKLNACKEEYKNNYNSVWGNFEEMVELSAGKGEKVIKIKEQINSIHDNVEKKYLNLMNKCRKEQIELYNTFYDNVFLKKPKCYKEIYDLFKSIFPNSKAKTMSTMIIIKKLIKFNYITWTMEKIDNFVWIENREL